MPTDPDDLDIVQVIKQEWTNLGGGEGSDFASSIPLNAFEDAPEVPCIFFVEPGRRNKVVALWPDQGKLRFRDIENTGTGWKLGELVGGSGGVDIGQAIFKTDGGFVYTTAGDVTIKSVP